MSVYAQENVYALPRPALLMRMRMRELERTLVRERLSHENLRVYQMAIEFLVLTKLYGRKIPRGNADLIDQLKRAALSIPLNIAEGAGKVSRPDSAKFFAIARGSALECGAILDSCRALDLIETSEIDKGKAVLIGIASMLSKLCR